MSTKKASIQDPKLLEKIKSLAVQAMFSDDELLEQLVLKGGNAMALVHQISARASVDLDFSLQQDFSENIADVQERINKTLSETFRANGFEVFDFKMIENPKNLTDDMKDFWGGYGVEFKLITSDLYSQFAGSIDDLRKRAINLGQGTKFLIDISRFEYVAAKQDTYLDGTLIYVYSPLMIVCEKLRAICQQLPEYSPIIKRGYPGKARPKDFVDIQVLAKAVEMDLAGDQMKEVLRLMFEAKKVPLSFLGKIHTSYDLHRTGFPAIADTISPDFELLEYDVYFRFVIELVNELEPFWNH